MIILRVDHVGLEGPGWLCKLPEILCFRHMRGPGPEVPALGVAKYFAKALSDGNDNNKDSSCYNDASKHHRIGMGDSLVGKSPCCSNMKT